MSLLQQTAFHVIRRTAIALHGSVVRLLSLSQPQPHLVSLSACSVLRPCLAALNDRLLPSTLQIPHAAVPAGVWSLFTSAGHLFFWRDDVVSCSDY